MVLRTINWKIENSIGLLMLDQPPANTMTQLFFDELRILIREIIPQTDIKALLIYGNGRHFSSGAEPFELKKRIVENLSSVLPGELPDFLVENTKTFMALEKLPIPSFAAIRGTCLGSAMELALFCRYRICADGAVLGFPETTFGLMPGCGGSIKLPGIIGKARAMELLISGRNFSATEAYNWGIVHKIAGRKTIIEETMKMATEMIKR
jgi:enoyl-CoA hydratase/carnithine racemase